jgi:hypothetical protein
MASRGQICKVGTEIVLREPVAAGVYTGIVAIMSGSWLAPD